MRVSEFYSGIGGFHFASKLAIPSCTVVNAFDLDEAANSVYFHNTGLTPSTLNLESISVQKLQKLESDIWLLSPPCQPFTRQGNQQDDQDPRSFSFLNLLEKFLQLQQSRPRFLCTENVVGFENSRTRQEMIETFLQCGLHTVEFILSPEQFGIPYSRPRYFCLARHAEFSLPSGQLHHHLPRAANLEEIPLKNFLDSCVDPELFVDEKVLAKCGNVMNIVSCENGARLNCFTKSYGGRYFKGTGSYLATQHTNWIPFISLLQDICCGIFSTEDLYLFQNDGRTPTERRQETVELLTELLCKMKIRCFSPSEVAKLHAFPSDFSFPSQVSRRRQYALLGNSLSITVVSELLKYLIQ